MTNHTLGQALACASRGWPVFPCMPGRKIPRKAMTRYSVGTDIINSHHLMMTV